MENKSLLTLKQLVAAVKAKATLNKVAEGKRFFILNDKEEEIDLYNTAPKHLNNLQSKLNE